MVWMVQHVYYTQVANELFKLIIVYQKETMVSVIYEGEIWSGKILKAKEDEVIIICISSV